MTLKDALTLENTVCNEDEISSKKQILERIGHLACRVNSELNYVEILKALIKRERLGSTTLGHGVAIPHARIEIIEQPIVCLITLQNAIRFYEDETLAVDIVFGILAPINATQPQLDLLSDISTHLQNKEYRTALREAKTNKQLYDAALTYPGISNHAEEDT